ncbi:MAG: phosphopyruvate hydratase [Candidatus Gottesmanbacteria bacterium]
MAVPIDTTIYGIYAREIINSRAIPTIETTVVLNSGYRGTSSVSTGMAIGKFDAAELRDGDPNRFDGMGVANAVSLINTVVSQALRGKSADDQSLVDKTMIELDGTATKTKFGANTMLTVSQAIAVAAANARLVPLHTYLNAVFNQYTQIQIKRIPIPIFNIINGGKHGAGNLNFQEFQIIPASNKSFPEAYQMGVEIYHATKKILAFRNAGHAVGDEGGFTPNLFTNTDAIEIVLEAIKASPYQFGIDAFLGLDLAATLFKTVQGYLIKDRATAYSAKDFIQYLKDIHTKYHVLYLEDPLEEDDWAGWTTITKEMDKDTIIAADDLLATNKTRLERAIIEKACSAILIKPSRVGTLTEVFDVIATAKKNDMKCIISHRSGETNDTFLADLSVAVQADYVKFGAPARGERVAKYNRLLELAAQLTNI